MATRSPFLMPKRPEHVGERGDLAKELEVGQRSAIAGLALPDDRGLVAARAAHVPIEAVHGDVQLAADEPLRMRRLPVEHRVPRPRPLQFAREFCPEAFGIAGGIGVNLLVAHAGLIAERLRGWEAAVFVEKVVELGAFVSFLGGHAGKDSVRHDVSRQNSLNSQNRLPSVYCELIVVYPPRAAKRARTGVTRSACATGAEPQEGAVVLDRHRRIAGFVGDDRKVVVRAGVPGIDADRALQQVARFRCAARGLVDQREVDDRFDVARLLPPARRAVRRSPRPAGRRAAARRRGCCGPSRTWDRWRSPAGIPSSRRRVVRGPDTAGRGCCAPRRSRCSVRAASGSASARCRSLRCAGNTARGRSDRQEAGTGAAAGVGCGAVTAGTDRGEAAGTDRDGTADAGRGGAAGAGRGATGGAGERPGARPAGLSAALVLRRLLRLWPAGRGLGVAGTATAVARSPSARGAARTPRPGAAAAGAEDARCAGAAGGGSPRQFDLRAARRGARAGVGGAAGRCASAA